MITVDDVKGYLKIPYDDEDSLITRMIQDGYDQLDDAINDFDEIYKENKKFARKADNWVLCYYMPDAYDQREGAYDGRRTGMNYPARSELTKLQLTRKESETE